MNSFQLVWDEIAAHVHQIAIEKGWWEQRENRNQAEMICLMHSELSEALEALRAGNPQDKHCPEFYNLEIELADVIIRIMDFAEAFDCNVGGAVEAKIAYNKQRAYKHGGKRF